jgi:hypothetical protein
LAAHCLACHGNNSSIPLVTYEQARPWGVAIKEQVLTRSMPPWGAVKGFGNLAPDYALSQEDILIIAAWVIGGAPQGNAQLLPPRQSATQPAPKPALKDGVVIDTRSELKERLQVLGIRPLVTDIVSSARVVARLPDGKLEPLVWLYRFDPKSAHAFTFREPLDLPAGTTVESSAPLRFALETLKEP